MELEWVFTYVVHSVVEHCIGLNSLSEETITDTSVMLYNVFVRCVWAFLVNKCITVLCMVKCLALMLLNSLAIQIVCRLTWAIVVFTSRKKRLSSTLQKFGMPCRRRVCSFERGRYAGD